MIPIDLDLFYFRTSYFLFKVVDSFYLPTFCLFSISFFDFLLYFKLIWLHFLSLLIDPILVILLGIYPRWCIVSTPILLIAFLLCLVNNLSSEMLIWSGERLINWTGCWYLEWQNCPHAQQSLPLMQMVRAGWDLHLLQIWSIVFKIKRIIII